jgi:hypothetical protein
MRSILNQFFYLEARVIRKEAYLKSLPVVFCFKKDTRGKMNSPLSREISRQVLFITIH